MQSHKTHEQSIAGDILAVIKDLHGTEILDSRGIPTVRVDIVLDTGISAWASVPSGNSTGTHEAKELRDGDYSRFGGKGVLKAVANINGPIRKGVVGMSPLDQESLDHYLISLDGTEQKTKLGANAILGVSLAAARAASKAMGLPLYQHLANNNKANLLPTPMFNILNGGVHATGSTDFQEFMIVPAGFPSFREALRCGAEVYRALGSLLKSRGLSTTVGDEGGFAPSVTSNQEAVELVLYAIEHAGYKPGDDCFIALDVAATELYHDGQYVLPQEGITLTGLELIDCYSKLVQQYPIVSIEDGLAEDDWHHWQQLTRRLGNHIQLVGDDLLTTNHDRIRRGAMENSANAALIKLNQIGTLTETLQAIASAREASWGIIVSHRSGETEDTTIADLAVASGVGQIKAGAPCRSERVAKYNRLLQIEAALGKNAQYAGSQKGKSYGSLSRT